MTSGDAEWRRGWPVVLAAMVCVSMGVLNTYTNGVFASSLHHEFGWTRAQISSSVTIQGLITGIGSPFLGKAIERFGARRAGFIGIWTAALGIACVGLLINKSFASYAAAWAFAAFLIVPASVLTWTFGVMSHFDRHRGLATAIALSGTSVMGGIAAPLARICLDMFGWRIAYVCLALGFALLSSLFCYFGFRERRRGVERAEDAAAATGMTLREAARTARYWRLFAVLIISGFGVTGLLVHLVPIETGRGISPLVAASTVSILAMAAVISRISSGYLLDRIHGPAVAAVVFACGAAGVALLLMHSSALWVTIGASALIGIVIGGELDAMTYMTSRYFGMRAFGSIYGTLFGVFAAGQALGPMFIGFAADLAGTYDVALWYILGAFVVSAAVIEAAHEKR